MKKIIVKIAFLGAILSILFSCTGCELISRILFGPTTDPMYGDSTPINYLVTTDKLKYDYGEEITVELLFVTDLCTEEARDGNTYCVKIFELPYYEIIGDSEVYTDGFEDKGFEDKESNSWYWYQATFKIRINASSTEEGHVGFGIKCVTDGWLYDEIKDSKFYTGNPEYPVTAGIYFYPNPESIIFEERRTW